MISCQSQVPDSEFQTTKLHCLLLGGFLTEYGIAGREEWASELQEEIGAWCGGVHL